MVGHGVPGAPGVVFIPSVASIHLFEGGLPTCTKVGNGRQAPKIPLTHPERSQIVEPQANNTLLPVQRGGSNGVPLGFLAPNSAIVIPHRHDAMCPHNRMVKQQPLQFVESPLSLFRALHSDPRRA